MEILNVTTVEAYVETVVALTADSSVTWFRGEPASPTPLLPKLWRAEHNENHLMQLFRMRAPMYAGTSAPDRKATDQWLFLAQHVGVPTRLLDWTEGALAALFFSLARSHAEGRIVWVLDPLRLNQMSDPQQRLMFPVTWATGDNPSAYNNIRCAWETGNPPGVLLPVAVYPTSIHARIRVQRSCFTVHGTDQRSLVEQVAELGGDSPLFARINVAPESRAAMLHQLHMLGVSRETLFPDLEGLAADLVARAEGI